MTKYQCSKKHIFTFPITSHVGTETNWIESKQCPKCDPSNFDIEEYSEPEVEETANVLVIELSTGPQLTIDKALADGYKIVNRYAKTYLLEKCKPKPEVEAPHQKEVEEAYKKIPEKAQL